MIARPPALRLPAERQGRGAYLLTIQVATPLDEARVGALTAIADTFSAAANHGAFPADGIAPSMSGLSLGSVSMDGRKLFVRADARQVDLKSFQLLRSMGEKLSEKGVEIGQFSLVKLQAEDNTTFLSPEPSDFDQFESYPGISSEIGFELEGQEFEDKRMRRCLIELDVCVEAMHVQRLAAWIDPWFGLLEAGAYAAPVGRPTEIHCFRGGVALFDEQTIEITVDRFQASESGWFALVNMIDACWQDAPLVTKLTVD